MPAVPSRSDRSDVVLRLRAAGCVFAEDEADLLMAAAGAPAELAAMVDRRVAGLPLEHVLGWAEFYGLRVAVAPRVFVPRRRTELLVREAAVLARSGAVVLDLCCGSGAVGAALLTVVDSVELHAVDISPDAVRCARINLADAGNVYEGDLFDPLPTRLQGRVDVLLANAPYVPSDAVRLMPPEARLHEPGVALDGGADGLDVLRRVCAGAPQWLAPGGRLLVETSERQLPETVRIVERNGLVAGVARSAELDATAVSGTAASFCGRPPAGSGRWDEPTQGALSDED
jgi:release factor glutamine methyltransferase